MPRHGLEQLRYLRVHDLHAVDVSLRLPAALGTSNDIDGEWEETRLSLDQVKAEVGLALWTLTR